MRPAMKVRLVSMGNKITDMAALLCGKGFRNLKWS